MPESNAAAKRRQFKTNRALGIGDETGRIPPRVKDPPKLMNCSVCQYEMKVTKTNTELTAHAESKHGKTLEDCFPGATALAEEMIAAANNKGKGDKGGADGGMTKAERKKKTEAGMDDLLNAGLGAAKKGGKKR
eukprot:scaffold1634_cov137-Amphora_coffeaeformis.AAC.7